MRTSIMYPVVAGTLAVFAFCLLRAADLAERADLRVMLIAGCYGYMLSQLGPLLTALAARRRRRRLLKAPVLPSSDAPFGDTSGKVVSIRDAQRERQAVPYGPWAQNVLPMVALRERHLRPK